MVKLSTICLKVHIVVWINIKTQDIELLKNYKFFTKESFEKN